MKIKWEKRYPRTQWPKKWHGLSMTEMKVYQPYVNRIKPGICGSYATAALIHYFIQKQYNHSLNIADLIKILEPMIEYRYPYKGTLPWDLKAGINQLLPKEIPYQARYHLISNPIVLEQLSNENPLPVIVGTARILGNHYGNHWVLVYAYGYNNEGKLFYRAYDNHGRIGAVIPASQTFAAVWLEAVQHEQK
ncbi:dihydrolipoamide dehydrogenase [Fundicoccus culcitae]|uniref:Dihydrolipoamide dehydrogenase n=1 Tax=Fundicoccus culcitae TaxID=2969821 RepID=A0ABY5P562_9LACT|nr:dihydrolipoamide dehydrogenase [Fundicoccus culcitae]UUX33837.1 dihydrolipoamide dehydrogenase [Fundicoccus culcitae]